MIGIVIVTHGNIAEELIKTAEMITGKREGVIGVPTDPSKSVDEIKKEIEMAIKKVDTGDGVLILTDMFGGTPSNISLSFLKDEKIEVVTGVNLPMLLKLFTSRENKNISQLAEFIKTYGQRNISIAREILRAKKSEKE